MIGQTLDRYRLDAKLGEGGMGVVYKATDTHLDRSVAIKVLPADKVADPDRKRRFVQEAKAASALNHPNIVTVHDIRSDAGVDFIVMEYAGGRTLDQVIAARPLAIARALRYGAQIADALASAHEAGIVHRDLKPSNVIVTDDDRVKVLDFGLAKLVEPADVAAAARTRTASMTEVGTVLGTAAYMSPEQAEGGKVDGRSDIFSLGTVLYEMVTGRRAFAGDSTVSVLAKILNEEPTAPSQINAVVPSEVERTVLRCLRKDPARRYQSMADLKVALEDLAADSASGKLGQATARRAPGAWRWAALAIAALALGSAYVALTSRRSPEPEAAPLHAVPLASLPGVTRSPSFSPDGSQIAFTWTGADGNNPDIYVQQVGAGAPLRLTTNADNDFSPEWSPDGRLVAFLRSQREAMRGESDGRRLELRLVPSLGGPERKLTEIQPRGFLRTVTLGWCPDSTCIVVTDSLGEGRPDAVFVVSVDSGEKRPLTMPPDSVLADTDPAISPDGKWLAFRRDTAPFNGQLTVLALGPGPATIGEPRALTPVSLAAYNPVWMPDSAEVVFSAQARLWRLRIAGDAAPERLPFVGEDGVTPAISRTQPGQPARLAYVRNYTDENIWRLDTSAAGAPASAPPAAAIVSTRRDAIAHIAPDGRAVTFTSTRSGDNEIWRADVTGGNAVQLTSMKANPGWPRWSPDGETIAFHSNPDGNGDIMLIPADGGKPRNLTSHPATDVFPTFSRDGRWIYFSSTRSGAPAIWKIPVAGGNAVQVSKEPGLMAIESVDGQFVYYTAAVNTGPAPLWRLPVGSGDAVKIADGVNSTSFDVIESGVYYTERAGSESRLQFMNFASRQAITVAHDLGELDFGLSASADGRTILFTRVDSTVNDLMLVDDFR